MTVSSRVQLIYKKRRDKRRVAIDKVSPMSEQKSRVCRYIEADVPSPICHAMNRQKRPVD